MWKIRFGLHAITDKEEDRLLFEYQKELSSLLGFEDNDQLAVEQFMQQYYLSAMQIRMVTELLLQHFDEAILRANERVRVSPVDRYFRIANDYIEVTSPDVFVRHPPALLKIFVAMGKDPDIKGIRAATVRLIQASVDLIDDEFRSNPEVTELFLTLLRSGEHLFSQLRRMERYGILGAYIPEFQHIFGQIQLHLLKIYTYVVIANVVISWLVAFNVLNTSNRFVYSILEFTYRLTEPFLNRIRRFLPNLGAFDISPIILLLLIWFIEMCMKLYVAPMIF